MACITPTDGWADTNSSNIPTSTVTWFNSAWYEAGGCFAREEPEPETEIQEEPEYLKLNRAKKKGGRKRW